MVAGHQADDDAFFPPKGQVGGVDDQIPGQLVMALAVLCLGDVVQHRRSPQPDPLGVAHAVPRLKLIEQREGQLADLAGMIGIHVERFTKLRHGVEDLDTSQERPLFFCAYLSATDRYFCIGHAPENLYLLTPLPLDCHLPILAPAIP